MSDSDNAASEDSDSELQPPTQPTVPPKHRRHMPFHVSPCLSCSWSGPRRYRTDVASYRVVLGGGGLPLRVPRSLESIWSGAGGFGRLTGCAASVREALQLLHAGVMTEPATRPLQPLPEGASAPASAAADIASGVPRAAAFSRWLAGLSADDACLVGEGLSLLAEAALRDMTAVKPPRGTLEDAAVKADATAPAAGARPSSREGAKPEPKPAKGGRESPKAGAAVKPALKAAADASAASTSAALALNSRFADGFSQPFSVLVPGGWMEAHVQPRDLTYAGALLGHVARDRAATDRLSALGPLLRLLRAYAAECGNGAADSEPSAAAAAGGAGAAPEGPAAHPRAAAAPANVCQALLALGRLLGAKIDKPGSGKAASAAAAPVAATSAAPAAGGAGVPPRAPPATAAASKLTPAELVRRAGWATELASIEAFEALAAVLEAAAAGALPAEAVKHVEAILTRLAGNDKLVAAVAGATANIRAETSRVLTASMRRAEGTLQQLAAPVAVAASSAAAGSVAAGSSAVAAVGGAGAAAPTALADPGCWGAAIELPLASQTRSDKPTAALGDLVAFEHMEQWKVGMVTALTGTPQSRVRTVWVSQLAPVASADATVTVA